MFSIASAKGTTKKIIVDEKLMSLIAHGSSSLIRAREALTDTGKQASKLSVEDLRRKMGGGRPCRRTLKQENSAGFINKRSGLFLQNAVVALKSKRKKIRHQIYRTNLPLLFAAETKHAIV